MQDSSGRLATPGTVSLHYRLFFRLPKPLPSIVSLHSLFHWYENSISYLVTAGASHQTRDLPSQAFCCSDGVEGDGCEGLIVMFCHHQGALRPPQHRRLQRKETHRSWKLCVEVKNCSSKHPRLYRNSSIIQIIKHCCQAKQAHSRQFLLSKENL